MFTDNIRIYDKKNRILFKNNDFFNISSVYKYGNNSIEKIFVSSKSKNYITYSFKKSNGIKKIIEIGDGFLIEKKMIGEELKSESRLNLIKKTSYFKRKLIKNVYIEVYKNENGKISTDLNFCMDIKKIEQIKYGQKI